ncbi:MAG: pyridoxamine 5'-phosphate oxidase family protein [Sandaracinaceae bacterium]|nr:MAG: general stress protein [Sandaracinaceae bacterium]HBQ10956.1 general stress protein [Myxococcales bacterium]
MTDERISENRARFTDILDSFDDAMLVTRDRGGAPRARPMHIAKRTVDGDLWFATSDESGKMSELEQDPRAAVTLQSKDAFVSITGRGQVVRDRSAIEEIWSPAMKAWFPEGKDDPNLTVLRFRAERGEYWDMRGMNKISYVYEAAKAIAKGERIESEREHHGELSL